MTTKSANLVSITAKSISDTITKSNVSTMRYFALLLFLFVFTPGQTNAAAVAAPVSQITGATPLSRTELETQLGRKLKFSERIAFGVLKGKLRKQAKTAAPEGKTDGLAIASFVIGLASILLLFANGLGFLTAITGLVLGIVSLGRINRNPGFRSGSGFAIAGIAINSTLIFLSFLALVILIAAFN